MAFRTTICSSVMLWGLTRPGITEWYQGKIRSRGSHPLERGLEGCQRTLTCLLKECPKRRASRFILFTLEPLAQVLHPVNHCPELREALAPVSPRQQLVHLQLIGQLQPAFA